MEFELPFEQPIERMIQESEETSPITETVYLADPVLLEKVDKLSMLQEENSNLLISLIGLIAGIVFLKSLLKGWLDA